MRSRAIGAVVMGPRNITGRYNFMSLEMGAAINGRVLERLPITDHVIERMEELGTDQGQPFRASRMLQYEWRPGKPIGEEDAYVIQHESQAQEQLVVPAPIELADPAPTPFNGTPLHEPAGADEDGEGQPQADNGVDQGEQATEVIVQNGTNEGAQATAQDGQNEGAQVIAPVRDEQVEIEAPIVENEGARQNENEQNGDPRVEPVTTNNDEDESGVEPETSEEKRRIEEAERRAAHFKVETGGNYGRGKRNKRRHISFAQSGKKKDKRKSEKKKKNQNGYSFLEKKFDDLNDCERLDYFVTAKELMETTGSTHLMERYTMGLLFASMSAKKGLEIYGDDAEEKLIAEFAHLIEYSVFQGEDADKLTTEEKKAAANMINLIEEKINRGH